MQKHIANMPQPTFPKFGSLPADIRKDIWVMATIRTPSVHFFNLSRGKEDIVRMKQITDKAIQDFVQAQGPSWDQLSYMEQRKKDCEVKDPLIGR
jgi:hypothetical protein